MIKLNEIRVGNWLLDWNTNKPFQLKRVHFEFFSPHHKPIPLTPEILEKCGFVKDEHIQQEFSYILKGASRISFVYYKANPSCFSIEQDEKMIDFASGRCKYLHQLQNLYFSLTGEELTYNPQPLQ